MEIHLYQIPILVSAVFLAGLSYYSWEKQNIQGSRPFIAVTLLMAGWSFLYGLQIGAHSLEHMVTCQSLADAVIAFLPVAWLVTIAEFSGYGQHLTRRRVVALCVIPSTSALLSLTSPWHGLFRYGNQVIFDGSYPVFSSQFGAWGWVHLIYTFGLMLFTLTLPVMLGLRSGQMVRKHTLLLMAGSLAPLTTSLLNLADWNPIPGYDLTPIAFAISALAVGMGLFSQQLADLLPVARDRVIERIQDGVVVVSAGGQVVDINPAGMQILLGNRGGPIPRGSPAGPIFERWPDLAAALHQPQEDQFEIYLPDEQGEKYYLARVSPFTNRKERWTGNLLLLHEITDYKIAENQMQMNQENLIGQLSQIEDLQEQLREQAIRDPLTGLFNRRHLQNHLEETLTRAHLEDDVMCVAMMDIDHFKNVNDTHGHKAGDLMLQALAKLFLHKVRGNDMVCRYGGEEFVLVLPGLTPEIALERAESWRKAFADLAVEYEGVSFSATLSIGLAFYPQDGTRGEELLRIADLALYEAKAAGRNQVKMKTEMRIPVDP